MPEPWYESVGPDVPLTQGDIILNCPLIGWQDQPVEGSSVQVLRQRADAFTADVIVMTQACDLEHGKVKNVVLCPHRLLGDYKYQWETAMREGDQNPSVKAWKRHCENLRDGHLWNLTILNKDSVHNLQTDYRIVDFHEVYTVPRQFLESLLSDREPPRLRLLPPYREHLSQAFARFFMRVGLPTEIQLESATTTTSANT